MKNSSNYEDALRISTNAINQFALVKAAYRSRMIGDAEFLAGKKIYDAAMGEFDVAYTREVERKRTRRIRSLVDDSGYSRSEATALVDGGF